MDDSQYVPSVITRPYDQLFTTFQLTDLLFFVCLVVVFILAYGVVNQAMRYPNSPLTIKVLKGIIYVPYWQIYGELYLDQLEGTAHKKLS